MSNPTIRHLQTLLSKERHVVANGFFGAYADGEPDRWSTIEQLVVTNSPTAWRAFLEPTFFEKIGRVFHADVRHAEHFITLSLTFENFERLVLVVVPQDRLRTVIQSGLAPWGQLAMIDSASDNVVQLLSAPPSSAPRPTPNEQLAQVQTLFHQVQEKAIGAIVAVMQHDRLLALQLVLGMLHDVMEMRQIWQRYHAATATAPDEPLRRYTGNDFADTMPALDGSPRRLLQLIEWGVWEFSSAARHLFPEWDERNHTIMIALSQARATLPADAPIIHAPTADAD